MPNAERLIQTINDMARQPLKDEIENFLDAYQDSEEAYTMADAFVDAYIFAEDHYINHMIANCRQILVAVGFYVPSGPDIQVTGKPLTISGIQHHCVDSLEQWLNK